MRSDQHPQRVDPPNPVVGPGVPSPHPDVDTVRTKTRDVGIEGDPRSSDSRAGRNLIAAIGIDRYQRWPSLANAVNDARGALALFEQLGFEQAMPMLIDDAANGRAIQSLVKDDLATIEPEDSLVLFYSGHGGTQEHLVGDQELTTGYLIPADAEDKVSTWVDLDAWLRSIARLRARHILVILDACHSGIALDSIIRWRDGGSRNQRLSTLSARPSRRIITSARGDERAMDGGPYPGHSLFTGCLIEALTHGLRRNGELATTGSELGLYLQRRVEAYPRSQQTPDFGAFELDQRGEMVLSSMRGRLDPQREVAVMVTPSSTDAGDLDADFPGRVDLSAGDAGSNVFPREDRSRFWARVEELLDPPTTTRGARAQRSQSYRHGAFAGNVRLGVVANISGAMRVHLWSTHRDHQHTLQSIERDVVAGSLAVPNQLGSLKTRPAEKGDQLYLEFAWHRSGPYLRELDRVEASIHWFVGEARNRFR